LSLYSWIFDDFEEELDFELDDGSIFWFLSGL
jgi:hypothetical protein